MQIEKELLDEFIQRIKKNFSYKFEYNGAYEYLIISDASNGQEILVIDFTGVGIDITLDEQYFNCGNSAPYNLKKMHELIELLMVTEKLLADQEEIDNARKENKN